MRALADHARLDQETRARVTARALDLVQRVRAEKGSGSPLDAFLREYSLASREGVILMCLAEALLRIPDAETADRLIADKVSAGDWAEHLGDSESLFVNASTWGLMLTGRVIQVETATLGSARNWFGRLASRISEPVARAALRQSMKILGHQFVMGRSVAEALARASGKRERAYRYSDLIKKLFREFVELRILSYPEHKTHKIKFVGSIAHYHRTYLEEVLAEYDLKADDIIQQPIYKLIDFHLKNSINE